MYVYIIHIVVWTFPSCLTFGAVAFAVMLYRLSTEKRAATCRYRTTMCRDGYGCTRHLCFFAHGPEQLRKPDHSALPPHLQQLAKQHEDPPLPAAAQPKSRRSASRSPADARSPAGIHSPVLTSQLDQLQASVQLMQLSNTQQQLLQQLQQLQTQQATPPSPPHSPYASFLGTPPGTSNPSSRPTSEAAFPLAGDASNAAAALGPSPWASGTMQDRTDLGADGIALIHNPMLNMMGSDGPGLYGAAWAGNLQPPQAARQQHDATEASFSWLVPSAQPQAASPHLAGSFDLPGFVHGGGFGAECRQPSPGPSAQHLPTADLILAASQPNSRSLSPLRASQMQQQMQQMQQQGQAQQWYHTPSTSPPPGTSPWTVQPTAGGPSSSSPLASSYSSFGAAGSTRDLLPGSSHGFRAVEPGRQGHSSRSGTATPGSPGVSSQLPDSLRELREYAASASLSASDAALVEKLVSARLTQAFSAGVAFAQQQAQQAGPSGQAQGQAQTLGQGMQLRELQQLAQLLQTDSPLLSNVLRGQGSS